MTTARKNSMVDNPESKILQDANSKSAIEPTKDQLVINVKAILNKNPESRTHLDNKKLNRFCKSSVFFSTLSQHTSVEVAHNILKYAHVHQILKNRTIAAKGQNVDNVIVLLSGRFGITEVADPTKEEVEKQDPRIYKRIIESSLKISRDLKRKMKQDAQDSGPTDFKTSKASMYDLVVRRYVEGEEEVFNISSLLECKKHSETVVSLNNCWVLSINVKIFYDSLASYVRKLKSDKISAFRKFQYFNCVESERLIQLVDELPLVTMKKGQFIYKEGDQMKQIYLLLKGSVKITKTVDLFRQNPNLFYLNRQKIKDAQILPFADFSQIYNYKPRTKLLQIGITNEVTFFGQEEMFSDERVRQVNAEVSSETAIFYTMDLAKLEENLMDIKNFMSDLSSGLYNDQTEKKISYRQKKLSDLLICETKNNMDYFFIVEKPGSKQTVKGDLTPRKYKINKVNLILSPTKQVKKTSPIKQAAYHTFNFDKFPLNLNKMSQQQRGFTSLSPAESKIIDLVHTVRPLSVETKPDFEDRRAKTSRQRSNPQNKHLLIDIHNPLFELGYFEKNRKEAMRIQKQSRNKSIIISQRPTNLKATMSNSGIF